MTKKFMEKVIDKTTVDRKGGYTIKRIAKNRVGLPQLVAIKAMQIQMDGKLLWKRIAN